MNPYRSRSCALALVAIAGCTAPNQTSPRPQAGGRTEVSAAEIADPYHPPARDTLDAVVYDGWKQYLLHCARCHGEDAHGSSFGPSLTVALKPDGPVPTQGDFVAILSEGRRDKGMPSAARMGLDSTYFVGLYRYLKGRSEGLLGAGRPARRAD